MRTVPVGMNATMPNEKAEIAAMAAAATAQTFEKTMDFADRNPEAFKAWAQGIAVLMLAAGIAIAIAKTR